MINRVLIRIKTVQLLYAYLLIEKPFRLESQPSSPTKEKRFAYSLYLDMNYLMLKIAENVAAPNKSYPLLKSSYIANQGFQEAMKPLDANYASGSFPFKDVLASLTEKVSRSLPFKEYLKNSEDPGMKEKFWEDIYNHIILADPQLNEIIVAMQGYTLSGFERMKAMMTDTFRNFYATGSGLNESLQTLSLSMGKARELYLRLLDLPVELTALRSDQLELNKKKLLPTSEDINPNMRLADNKLARKISEDPDFNKYIEQYKISWISEDKELLEHLLKEILSSDIYQNYIVSSDFSLERDVLFWKDIFNEVILNDREFLEYLENKSVFWNDDLEITSTFLFKTFKNFEKDEAVSSHILPMYKDDEDAAFGAELFRYVISDKNYYRQLIDKASEGDKWEADRLAFMDVVVTMTALAEILHFPKIPLTVSINEYIEIAKSYSSSKSGAFVHGLLAKIISGLKEEGVLRDK